MVQCCRPICILGNAIQSSTIFGNSGHRFSVRSHDMCDVDPNRWCLWYRQDYFTFKNYKTTLIRFHEKISKGTNTYCTGDSVIVKNPDPNDEEELVGRIAYIINDSLSRNEGIEIQIQLRCHSEICVQSVSDPRRSKILPKIVSLVFFFENHCSNYTFSSPAPSKTSLGSSNLQFT